MTPSDAFSRTILECAEAGVFDRNQLVTAACELTRDLRDTGATPEEVLKTVKKIMTHGPVDPPGKIREEVVTNCIETFFAHKG